MHNLYCHSSCDTLKYCFTNIIVTKGGRKHKRRGGHSYRLNSKCLLNKNPNHKNEAPSKKFLTLKLYENLPETLAQKTTKYDSMSYYLNHPQI